MSDTWNETLKRWIREGPPEETPTHEDVLMWGVWVRGIGDDECHPPEAVFRDKEKADAFTRLFDVKEWDVSQCIVTVQNRDNYKIPEKP